MSEKIYCGNGKEITTQYGTMLKLSFNTTDLEKLNDNLSEKGWVNVVVSKRKEAGKFGETHSLTIDTWKPDAKQAAKSENKVTTVSNDFEEDSDIPF